MDEYVKLRMVVQDHPLAALADKLGYTLYVEQDPGGGRKYSGEMPTGVRYFASDLLEVVVGLIQQERAVWQSAVSPKELEAGRDHDEPWEQIRELQEEILQQREVIRELKQQLDLEHRYLMDTQARGFLAFLRRQPATPWIERWLTNPDFVFHTQAGRWRYEYCLREKLHASEQELEAFKQLWKLQLLESPPPG